MIIRNGTRQNLSEPVLFNIIAPTFFESSTVIKGINIIVNTVWKKVTEVHIIVSGQWKKLTEVQIISSSIWKKGSD